MKKAVKQAPEQKSTFRRTFITVLFVSYAWIVIALYLKQNGFFMQALVAAIMSYLSPFLQGGQPPAVFVNNLVLILMKMSVPFAVIVSMYGFGRAAGKILSLATKTELEKVAFSIGVGSFLLILAVFLLAAMKLLLPLPVGIILACGIAGTFTGNVDFRALKDEVKLSGLPLLAKIAVFLGALCAFIAFVSALVPEIFYDSLVYHIAAANWYTLSHSLRPPLSETLHFFVPGYARLLYSVCFLFSDEISAKILHFAFMGLTAGAIYTVGKNMFGRTVGIFSALAFITMPSVGMVGVRSAMESFLCFFEFLALAGALKFIETGERKWLGVSGVLLGTAIGCKYLSIMSWVAIGLALVTYIFSVRRPLKEIIVDMLLWNGAILAAYGPWFAYNIYYTGNPVYPALWQHIGHMQTKSFTAVSELGRTFGIKDVLLSPWTISMGMKEEAYAGVMFLLFMPLLFLTKWHRTHLKYVLIYAAAYWLMWMNIGPYFYFRYYLPAMPAVCLLVGYAMSEFNGMAVRAVVVAVIIINMGHVAGTLKNIYFPVDYILGNMSKTQYLSANRQTYPNPYYSAAEWINKNLNKDATILLEGEERAYYLKRPYVPMSIGDKNYLITLIEKSKDSRDLARRLKEDGITHILLNVPEAKRLKGYDIFNFEPREYAIFLSFWHQYLREVYRDAADIMMMQRGIFSMRQQQPEWWRQYASDESNYVYVYEILGDDESLRPHAVPQNFLAGPGLFTGPRWEKLVRVPAAREGK